MSRTVVLLILTLVTILHLQLHQIHAAPTALDCLESIDPNPLAQSAIGLSDSSLFFATNYGLVNGPVDVRFVGGSLKEDDTASEVVELDNPRAATCFTVGPELASISWGKSIDSANDIIAIGGSNRRMTGQTQYYGVIDLFQVTPLASTPAPPAAGHIPPARDVEDWLINAPGTDAAKAGPPVWLEAKYTPGASIDGIDSPWLGLGVALAADGSSVASFYDASTVGVFTTRNRASSRYNTTDGDRKLSTPANFVADSLAYRGNYLAVSGTVQLTATKCYPAVTVYVRTAGVWDAGTSTPLKRVTTLSDPKNAIACGTGPANAIPVSLSEDGSHLVASVVEWETVFFGETDFLSTTTTYLTNDGSANNFGRAVDFAYTPTGPNVTEVAFNVLTRDGIFTFMGEDFKSVNVNFTTAAKLTPPSVALQVAAVYPNRQQRPLEPSTLDLIAVASNSGFSAAIDRTGAIFANPSAPAGKQFHPDLNAFVVCPPGFFQDGEGSNPSSAKWVPNELWPEEWVNVTNIITPDRFLRSGGLQQPCAFCPAFTYQDKNGSVTCKICEPGLFCPPGSAYPYEDEVLGKPEYESGQGEFETESIAEAFEELVVNRLFSPSQPSMITVLTITALCVTLGTIYVASFLPVQVRNFAAWTLNLLVYLNLPEEEALIAGDLGHGHHGGGDAHGAPAGGEHGHGTDDHGKGAAHEPEAIHGGWEKWEPHGATVAPTTTHSSPNAVHPEPPAGAHGGGHGDAHGDAHGHGGHDDEDVPICGQKAIHLHSAHCLTGFFNIIFVVLCIATLVFAVTFLSHYDAKEPCGEGKNNCVAVDDIHYTDGVKQDYTDGFNALGSVQANLFVDIIGLTGISKDGGDLCTEAGLINVLVSGCTINGDTRKCNETSMFEIADVSAYVEEDVITTEFLKPQADHTCRLRWNIVLGTNFQTTMVTEFQLPAFASWSSLRFWYLQSPQVYDEANPTVIQHEGYAVGQTNFVENVQRTTDYLAGSTPVDSYPPSTTERQWSYGVLGREIQTSSDAPVTYFRTWWNFVTSNPSNATMQAYRTFLMDTAPVTTIRIVQLSNYANWRLQAVVKLIQPSLAFLTVLLGLIGVLHLVHFGLEVTLVGLHAYHHIKHRAKQAHQFAAEQAGKMGNAVLHRKSSRAQPGMGSFHGTTSPHAPPAATGHHDSAALAPAEHIPAAASVQIEMPAHHDH